MAKKPSDPTEVIAPSDFPATTPRDLHPTSDIRFVIHELGKLTSEVAYLVGTVKSHGEKIGEVKDAISFVKGALWVIGLAALLVGSIIGLVMSGKISIAFH